MLGGRWGNRVGLAGDFRAGSRRPTGLKRALVAARGSCILWENIIIWHTLKPWDGKSDELESG